MVEAHVATIYASLRRSLRRSCPTRNSTCLRLGGWHTHNEIPAYLMIAVIGSERISNQVGRTTKWEIVCSQWLNVWNSLVYWMVKVTEFFTIILILVTSCWSKWEKMSFLGSDMSTDLVHGIFRWSVGRRDCRFGRNDVWFKKTDFSELWKIILSMNCKKFFYQEDKNLLKTCY